MVSMDRERRYIQKKDTPAPASLTSLPGEIASAILEATHSSGFRVLLGSRCQKFIPCISLIIHMERLPGNNFVDCLTPRSSDAASLSVLYRDSSALYQVWVSSNHQTAWSVHIQNALVGELGSCSDKGKADIGAGSWDSSFFAFSFLPSVSGESNNLSLWNESTPSALELKSSKFMGIVVRHRR